MSELKADPKGKKPTTAEAKAAWDAELKPSLNKVLAALHAAGFTGISKSSLARWQKNKWEKSPKQAAEAVATAKEVAQGVVDAKADEAELKELGALALSVLAETAAKESLIAQVLLARRVQRRAMELIRFAPKEAAKLIEALKKDPASNVTVVMPPKPDDRPMHTVNGVQIEHSATERPMNQFEIALQDFRQRQPLQVVK